MPAKLRQKASGSPLPNLSATPEKSVSSTLAAPAIVSHGALGQALRKVKMGSAFTTTTNAAFLMPNYLKAEGIDLEPVMFPSLVQRMQPVLGNILSEIQRGKSASAQQTRKL